MSNIESEEVKGILEITAVSGSDIKTKTFSKPNLYVVFEIGNKKQKTGEKSGKNPKWNEVVKFDIYEDSSVLKANVYNSKYNEFVGGLELLLKETIYIENQNVKMKIYNEKHQEKGELHLLLRYQKKVTPLNLFSNSQGNSDNARIEEDDKGINVTNKYTSVNSNEIVERNSHPSMSVYKNMDGTIPINNPSVVMGYNGRPTKVIQNTNRRSRSLSPMVYENEVYCHNQNIPTQLEMTNILPKDRLYHFKSDESLSIKQNDNLQKSKLDNYNISMFSQPSYSYLDSQSDDDLDVYSSSLPNNTAFFSSSTTGQYNNHLFNNSKIPSTIKIGQPHVKAEFNNGKYINPSIKSDSASLYSNNSSNLSVHSSLSKSPSLVIKTSINSMKMGMNSASSTPHSSTPRTLTPLSAVTPISSTSSLSTPTRGTSFLPRPVQNSHRQSLIKSYVPIDTKRVEIEAMYAKSSQENNGINNDSSGEIRNRNISNDGQLRVSRHEPTVGKVQYEHTNSSPLSLHDVSTRGAQSIKPVEQKNTHSNRSYKVRSISNDSRLYKGRISLTSNNTIASLEDSFNMNDHSNRVSNGTDSSNRYSNKSSSYSTEILVIDSSLDNFDQHSSSLLGVNSLRRSASFDSFIKERSSNRNDYIDISNEEDGERGRRIIRDTNAPKQKPVSQQESYEQVFLRPAKSKNRVRKERVEDDEDEYDLEDDSTTTFSRNLSLSRQASLKPGHYRSGSQPVGKISDKRLLKSKSSSNSETSTTSDDKNNSLTRKVKNISDECVIMDSNNSDDSKEAKIPKYFKPRRSSLSSKALQQNLHIKDLKSMKVISPASAPLTNKAKISTIKELKESIRPSEALYTNVNELSPRAPYAQAINNPKDIDLLQKELNKISISLKMKKMGKARSNSDGAKSEIFGESGNEYPDNARSSPRIMLNNKIGPHISSATSSPNQSPKISKTTPVKALKIDDTSMTNNTFMEEGKSLEFSDESSLNSMDKKDKMMWKDKYLRYIRKNSIQNKSKLDQCISETNCDPDRADISFNDTGVTHSNYSFRKDSILIPSSSDSTSTFEEVKVIDATYNSINSSALNVSMSNSNSAINISNIQFSDNDEKNEPNTFITQSQEVYPQFANISLSTINQDDDIVSDKDIDIISPTTSLKMFNDNSYEIMNSKDGNISTSNMNSQELLSRTNLSSISFNENSNEVLVSPVMGKGNRTSAERKKIMDNNFNILSQQIQKIRNEVAANNSNSSMEEDKSFLHPTRSCEDNNGNNTSFDNPPRLDSNVDMNEALGNLKTNSSSVKPHHVNRYEEETPKRPLKNVISHKRNDSLAGSKTFGKNIVIKPKPILKNATPTSSANSTPTQINLELTTEDLKKLQFRSSMDALTPKNYEPYDQYSNTSTISSNSATPNLHLDEEEIDGDTTIYPTNKLDDKKDENQDTITRNNKIKTEVVVEAKPKAEEDVDEDVLTPKLNQTPYIMSQRSSTLQIQGSAAQADIYNISFGEESDDELPPIQSSRNHSLRYRCDELAGNPNGSIRMRSNSLSSMISSTYSVHNKWEDDESVISLDKDDDKAARRLTFGMDTNEQLFKIRRSNSLSSISTTSSYTYTLISKDSEKALPNRNKLSQLISNSYAPQRIPPVRPMVNVNNHVAPPTVGLHPPIRATNLNNLNYVSPIGSYNSSTLSVSNKYDTSSLLSAPYQPDQEYNVGPGVLNSKIPNPNHFAALFNNPNYYRPGSPNAPSLMSESANLTASTLIPTNRNTLNCAATVSSTQATPAVTKPQKSHKRFGHFKKGSISNLPVNTYHPLTHHGYKGNENFITEEAVNFQLKSTALFNNVEEGSFKSKSKPTRIPFLNHNRNNSNVSHDSNGTNSTINVLSSSKLEMHPISNQL